MKRLLGSLAALLVLISIAGCGPDARYCANCETAVAQSRGDERARLVRGRCKVNGMEIDCRYDHAFCPECRNRK